MEYLVQFLFQSFRSGDENLMDVKGRGRKCVTDDMKLKKPLKQIPEF